MTLWEAMTKLGWGKHMPKNNMAHVVVGTWILFIGGIAHYFINIFGTSLQKSTYAVYGLQYERIK